MTTSVCEQQDGALWCKRPCELSLLQDLINENQLEIFTEPSTQFNADVHMNPMALKGHDLLSRVSVPSHSLLSSRYITEVLLPNLEGRWKLSEPLSLVDTKEPPTKFDPLADPEHYCKVRMHTLFLYAFIFVRLRVHVRNWHHGFICLRKPDATETTAPASTSVDGDETTTLDGSTCRGKNLLEYFGLKLSEQTDRQAKIGFTTKRLGQLILGSYFLNRRYSLGDNVLLAPVKSTLAQKSFIMTRQKHSQAVQIGKSYYVSLPTEFIIQKMIVPNLTEYCMVHSSTEDEFE